MALPRRRFLVLLYEHAILELGTESVIAYRCDGEARRFGVLLQMWQSRSYKRFLHIGGALFQCGETGHGPPTCPLAQCFGCKRYGHWVAQCPERRRVDPNLNCWKCRGSGHDASSCDSQRSSSDSNSLGDTSRTASGSGSSSSNSSQNDTADHRQLKVQGDTAYISGDFETAILYYTQAIGLSPKDPILYANRAAAYMGMKNFRSALADCQTALQEQAPTAKLLNRLGVCYYAIADVTQALAAFRRALIRDPEYAAAKRYREKTLALQKNIADFESAHSGGRWRNAQDACAMCTRALREEGGEIPHDWRCWEVEVQIALGNWDAASTTVEFVLPVAFPNGVFIVSTSNAIQDHIKSSTLAMLRGLVLFLSGKPTLAAQQLVASLKLDPDNQRARKHLERVRSVEVLKEQGKAHFLDGQFRKALQVYEQILEVIGQKKEEGGGGHMRATILSNGATAYLKLYRLSEALLYVNISLLLNPKSFKALRTRAKIHRHNKNYDDAVRDLNQALREATTPEERHAVQQELQDVESLKRRGGDVKGYYRILGLSQGCSETDIRQAYMRESLQHHPDRPADSFQGGNEEHFKLVVEAYEVLSDPGKRKLYDKRTE
ncbi:hypothetical protein EVG20_g4312 [Dentipellis fragilis]|uniref:J domain-containing protein n=1 Tax=Dentipellis fragilis TaxID=205917 RepID=A0A4Y9YW13_9AGAM|nr:hypothetical protein EVG20_g4312 [Dentipellis fragilis]